MVAHDVLRVVDHTTVIASEQATGMNGVEITPRVDTVAPWHDTSPVTRRHRRGRRFPLLADHDFADLYHWAQVSVVGNVAHDLLGVRAEPLLEGFDRVGID